MITAYNRPLRTKITQNLAHQRPRTNPTNSHTQLWGNNQNFVVQRPRVRFTATFHSDIFHLSAQQPTHKENKKDQQANNKQKQAAENSITFGVKNSRQIAKQPDVSPEKIELLLRKAGIASHVDKQKEQLLASRPGDRSSYCRSRKIRDLSSNPIVHERQKNSFPPNRKAEILNLPAKKY